MGGGGGGGGLKSCHKEIKGLVGKIVRRIKLLPLFTT